MEITNTITVPEILWTVFCLIGLFYNFRIFIRAFGDLRHLQIKRIDGLRRYSGRLSALTYGTWTLVQLVFVLIGVVAMTQPSPPHQIVTALQIEITVAFILTSLIIAGASFYNERGRRELLRKIAEIEDFD